MAVQQTNMDLTQRERAKITDSAHSIQSARASLNDIDEEKIPQLSEIQDCLESADRNLRNVLRGKEAAKKR